MNYLAHLYLSGTSEKLMVGNFIGDYVKGKKYLQYPEEIAKGILLHRKIDSFTDSHSLVKQSKTPFRDEFGLYSGIVVDFFYDHFLAKNWSFYSEISLRTYAKRAHAILLSNFGQLPVRVQGFLPFLIQNKRLESYATIEGIVHSMKIMGNYTSLPSKSEYAKKILEENYITLEQNFTAFMEEIIQLIENETEIKIKRPDYTTEP